LGSFGNSSPAAAPSSSSRRRHRLRRVNQSQSIEVWVCKREEEEATKPLPKRRKGGGERGEGRGCTGARRGGRRPRRLPAVRASRLRRPGACSTSTVADRMPVCNPSSADRSTDLPLLHSAHDSPCSEFSEHVSCVSRLGSCCVAERVAVHRLWLSPRVFFVASRLILLEPGHIRG